MSGTDSPQRGIEPPASGYGPPPPPDFGIAKKRRASPAPDVADADVPAAQPRSRPWAIIAIIAAIVAVFVLVLGLAVVGIGSLLSLSGDPGDPGAAAPSSSIDDPDQSDPGQDLFDPGPSSAAVETVLQAKIDEYKRARDDGSLWTRIPDSTYNRTALSAFLYFLTDLRLAASFGADTSDYLDQANELERKLLNEEPLGSDISIKLEDRTFTYDGDTGEGGYTTNP